MSKTTKTRPLSVRMADPLDHKVGAVEIHHHEDGPCTLPASPLTETTGRCRFVFSYRGVNPCGCAHCTWQAWRRRERRRDRHRSRADLRRVLVGVGAIADDVEEEDVD